MGLRLRVHRDRWMQSVAAAAAERPGVVPVVKGNGYGFGRATLMPIAAGLADTVAVGTVYEARDVAELATPHVLTPHVDRLPPLPAGTVLTVGHLDHVAALADQRWQGAVVVKLQSSMRRFGVAPAELPALVAATREAGLSAAGYAIHLPLAGDDAARVAEVEQWLPHLDPLGPLSLSHLSPTAMTQLRSRHPERRFTLRVGSALWHADKSTLQLSADVLDAHPVSAGEPVGYHHTPSPASGTLVLVAAGSAHGVAPLPPSSRGGDPLSPFHHRRERVPLAEPPHMHTSLVVVPDHLPPPAIGDRVDVQRPLITTMPDETEWVDG